MSEMLDVVDDGVALLHINKMLSKPLQVVPLKEGEFAKYRLYAADRDDITRSEDGSGKRMKYQQVYSFIGHKKIYDPIQKRKIMIKNITSFKEEKLPDGQLKQVPIEGRVIFPRTGELIVTDRDQDLYAYLERMDENGSNEFRDPKITKPVFYRVNTKKQAMQALELDYIKLDAMMWVRDANETEIKTIHRGLDDDTKKKLNADNFEQLKRGIFQLAQEFPILVLKASTNKEAKLKVQIMDAERYRVILFSEGGQGEERGWYYIVGKPELICNVAAGIHKVDAMLKFFIDSKDGKAWYEKIVSTLKQILEAKR